MHSVLYQTIQCILLRLSRSSLESWTHLGRWSLFSARWRSIDHLGRQQLMPPRPWVCHCPWAALLVQKLVVDQGTIAHFARQMCPAIPRVEVCRLPPVEGLGVGRENDGSFSRSESCVHECPTLGIGFCTKEGWPNHRLYATLSRCLN